MRDLIVCSVVSKYWCSVSEHVKAAALDITGYELHPSSAVCILQWLQQKQDQQCFGNLQTLSLHLDFNSDLSGFGLAVLVFAGLWPITTCDLAGPFDLIAIVHLLPPSLQHLHVIVDSSRSRNGDLSMFQRFPDLQSLHLIADDAKPSNPPLGFGFDSISPLCSLRHLHLSQWRFHTRLLRGSAALMTPCLPSLTHAAVHVHSDDAAEFAKLPHLEYLSMVLLGPVQSDAELKVKAGSPLYWLRLCVSEACKVQVCLQKRDILYELASFSGLRSVTAVGFRRHLHALPKDFQGVMPVHSQDHSD